MKSIYRLFKLDDGARPPARHGVVALIGAAALVTTLALVHVTRQHEILRLGYQLSRASERLRALREVHRRLELERATLTAPDRVRRLATQLGMVPVPPDQIRIIERPRAAAAAPDRPVDAAADARRAAAPDRPVDERQALAEPAR